jgi:hypothetical protein
MAGHLSSGILITCSNHLSFLASVLSKTISSACFFSLFPRWELFPILIFLRYVVGSPFRLPVACFLTLFSTHNSLPYIINTIDTVLELNVPLIALLTSVFLLSLHRQDWLWGKDFSHFSTLTFMLAAVRT